MDLMIWYYNTCQCCSESTPKWQCNKLCKHAKHVYYVKTRTHTVIARTGEIRRVNWIIFENYLFTEIRCFHRGRGREHWTVNKNGAIDVQRGKVEGVVKLLPSRKFNKFRRASQSHRRRSFIEHIIRGINKDNFFHKIIKTTII